MQAIVAEGLSKRYELGVSAPIAGRLTDSVALALRKLRGKGQSSLGRENIWALRDVSFDVSSGEVIGIIGRNGAGKSTLLKILSRITEPSAGWARLNGRVGSLLEVGTGFHPELTGRENIYLNGVILGMRRSEINRRFDEIVAFSEIERFIDTPVKRYSSGMYVRLAFSVAAHFDPEILIVDEVLAVGDASFQQKCLGRMHDAAGGGKTVLLVSHNMGAIQSLADRAIWIDGGKIAQIGPSSEVVRDYLASAVTLERSGDFDLEYIKPRRVTHEKYAGQLELLSVRLRDEYGDSSAVFEEGSKVVVDLTFHSKRAHTALEIFLRIRSSEGQLLFTCLPGKREEELEPGRYRASISFELGRLLPGTYTGDVVLLSHAPQDNVSPAFHFEVLPGRGEEDFRTTLFGVGASESTFASLGYLRASSAWEDLDLEVPS